MRLAALFAACSVMALVGAACRGNVLGQPCERDEQCGPGYDCYPDKCVRVCTGDDECQPGTVCYRYHCVAPEKTESAARGAASEPTAQTPPVPDATAAELRAIRYELERLRQDVARLLEARGLDAKAPSPPMPVPDVPQP